MISTYTVTFFWLRAAFYQFIDYGRILSDPVLREFYFGYIRIIGCFVQEAGQVVKRLVWEMYKDILFINNIEHLLGFIESFDV